MTRSTRLVLALSGAALLASCAGASRRETRALLAAVDRYRRASPASREADARAVRSLACTDAAVCDAKRACVAAIDPTARALGLKDEVARRLADVEQKRLPPDSPEARALPAELDEAARLLEEGRRNMSVCEEKLAGLQTAQGV